jgi:3-dehydroquinate dehydratase-1
MERSEGDFLASAQLAKEMGADCLEVRADGLGDPDITSVRELLKAIKKETGLPIVLTCRMKEEGGMFQGREEERMEIIQGAIQAADLVDIELRVEGKMRDTVVEKAKGLGREVICSYHNFKATPAPDILASVFQEEFRAGADIAKVAVMTRKPLDVLALLEAGHRASARGAVCAIPMGGTGKAGRVAAPFFGSVLSYGYVTHETGPGQLSVRELRTLFDIMGIGDEGWR